MTMTTVCRPTVGYNDAVPGTVTIYYLRKYNFIILTHTRVSPTHTYANYTHFKVKLLHTIGFLLLLELLPPA